MIASPARALRSLFEEARRRARRRRLGYAILATTIGLGIGVWILAGRLGDSPTRPSAERPAAAQLALARTPYIGVSCAGRPNVISCDRVGLAVWLERPVKRLRATIDGRPLTMRPTTCPEVSRDQPCGTFFQGFLQPAGLLNGSLKVRPDHGTRWFGTNPPRALIELRSERGRAKLKVRLSAGWG